MNIVVGLLALLLFQDIGGELVRPAESVLEPSPIVAGPLDNLVDQLGKRFDERFADRDRFLADLFQASENRQVGRVGQLVDEAVERIQAKREKADGVLLQRIGENIRQAITEARERGDEALAVRLEAILERWRDPGEVGPIRERLQVIAGKLNEAVDEYRSAAATVGPVRDLVSRITWLAFALGFLFVAFIIHGLLKKANLI